MKTDGEFELVLDRLKGLTVAIVYIFEGENAEGFAHYHVWKSNIISGWLNAIQNLGCRPFILDVRTFAEKAFANTLPHIDFVVNLNCGSCTLSPMAIVPATCAFLGIPCIPCDCTAVLTGENKLHSNILAQASGIPVPREINPEDSRGIFRPLNWGSSRGIKVGSIRNDILGIYQEFIPGFDVTTPVVFNPCSESFAFLPSILYVPDTQDTCWFFGENAKDTKVGYSRQIIHGISDILREKYLHLLKTVNVQTYCRIDARIKSNNFDKIHSLPLAPLSEENLYFIEINTMPTISSTNSFGFSYKSVSVEDECHIYLEKLKSRYKEMDVYTFLLVSSMATLLKPSAKENRIKATPFDKCSL